MRIRLFAFCLLLGGCRSQLPPLPDWQSPEGARRSADGTRSSNCAAA